MGWNLGKYYTRSRKINGRVVREYVGGGDFGTSVAKLDALKREGRDIERAAWSAEKEQMTDFDQPVDRICELADTVVEAALLATGFHNHRGQWRRKRG